jgi:uncharacterized protein (DUF1919 family)
LEKTSISKEAKEAMDERKAKIQRMELVFDMKHAKDNEKQSVIQDFLTNMVDPLFPFKNQPLENASWQHLKVDIS